MSYSLKGEEDTTAYNCVDSCTYSGADGDKVCFAAGDLAASCSTAVTGASTAAAGGTGWSAAHHTVICGGSWSILRGDVLLLALVQAICIYRKPLESTDFFTICAPPLAPSTDQ